MKFSKKVSLVFLGALFALVLCSCKSDCNSATNCAISATASSANLDNTAWVPTFVKLAKGVEAPANGKSEFGQVFISFKNSSQGLRVHGMSGVNVFNGSLKFERGGEVDFSPMMSTMMAGKYLDYERNFLKNLDEVDSIALEGDVLNFYKLDDGKKILLMSFKKGNAAELLKK